MGTIAKRTALDKKLPKGWKDAAFLLPDTVKDLGKAALFLNVEDATATGTNFTIKLQRACMYRFALCFKQVVADARAALRLISDDANNNEIMIKTVLKAPGTSKPWE